MFAYTLNEALSFKSRRGVCQSRKSANSARMRPLCLALIEQFVDLFDEFQRRRVLRCHGWCRPRGSGSAAAIPRENSWGICCWRIRCRHLLRHQPRGLGIGFRQQPDELFTADPGDEIPWSIGRQRQRLRDAAQAFVTLDVAVMVVVLLEIIDIQHDHRQRQAAALGSCSIRVPARCRTCAGWRCPSGRPGRNTLRAAFAGVSGVLRFSCAR